MSMQLDATYPLYIQIMDEIKKRAVRGQYLPNGKLPSVRQLAIEMEVNPNTIARAYMELEREGFIFTRRGNGSFVTETPARVDEERKRLADEAVKRFVKEIRDLNLNNNKEILDSIAKQFSQSE